MFCQGINTANCETCQSTITFNIKDTSNIQDPEASGSLGVAATVLSGIMVFAVIIL